MSSLFIASIGAVSFFLRPRSLWWLAASATIALHPLVWFGTPINILAAEIFTLLMLIALFFYEHRATIHVSSVVALGVIAGAGLATRTLLFVVAMAIVGVFLVSSRVLSRHHVLTFVIFAILTTVIINPLLWTQTIPHLQSIFEGPSIHRTIGNNPAGLPSNLYHLYAYKREINIKHYSLLLLRIPITIISIGWVLALFEIALITRKKPNFPVPMQFIIVLLGMTIFLTFAYTIGWANLLRHFFPLIYLWDVLLSLFILDQVNQLRLFYGTCRIQTPERIQK